MRRDSPKWRAKEFNKTKSASSVLGTGIQRYAAEKVLSGPQQPCFGYQAASPKVFFRQRPSLITRGAVNDCVDELLGEFGDCRERHGGQRWQESREVHSIYAVYTQQKLEKARIIMHCRQWPMVLI